MKYDIETVICYHGGIYNDNVNKRIAELANIKIDVEIIDKKNI